VGSIFNFLYIGTSITLVWVKLVNFKSLRVKALLSKAFTLRLLKFTSLTRTNVKLVTIYKKLKIEPTQQVL
ncbi:MAG: hypothetical protein ACK5K8_04435, partial [Pseudanabaena sp.]